MKKLLFLLLISQISLSQTIIKGTVTEAGSNEPIAFASVGIKGKAVGTVCDENGRFELKAHSFSDSDSLKISAIGYSGRSVPMAIAKNFTDEKISLKASAVALNEVKIKPQKAVTRVLGNKNYNKNISISFSGPDGGMKGCEVAIRANNKKGQLVFIENCNFYIVKNLYSDSLTFRLNFYKEDNSNLPGENILRKPIIFKVKQKEGVVSVNLKHLLINTDDDFFISLECLEEKMDKYSFAFSGSFIGPSFAKFATFADWEKLPVGGVDFNVTVTYQK